MSGGNTAAANVMVTGGSWTTGDTNVMGTVADGPPLPPM